MFIVVLLLAVFVLWNNLKYYTRLFVPDKYVMKEYAERMLKIEADGHRGAAIFLVTFLSILPFAFYCISANYFIDNKALLGYSIFCLILVILSLKNAIKLILGAKVSKRNLFLRIIYPIQTLFIGYFIYVYIINLT